MSYTCVQESARHRCDLLLKKRLIIDIKLTMTLKTSTINTIVTWITTRSLTTARLTNQRPEHGQNPWIQSESIIWVTTASTMDINLTLEGDLLQKGVIVLISHWTDYLNHDAVSL